MEKPALLCSENVVIKWYNQLGSGLKISYKLNIPLCHTLWLILLLGTDQREIFKHSQKHVYANVHRSFTPNSPKLDTNYVNKRIYNKLPYVLKMNYHWATSRTKSLIQAAADFMHIFESEWMNVWVKELFLGEYVLHNSISVMLLNQWN